MKKSFDTYLRQGVPNVELPYATMVVGKRYLGIGWFRSSAHEFPGKPTPGHRVRLGQSNFQPAGLGEGKRTFLPSLQASEIDFHLLNERGLRYAEQNKLLDTYSRVFRDLPAWEPEKRAEIEAELKSCGERFKAAMESKQDATAPEIQAVEG